MSYAQRRQMSGNRTAAIVIVALIHAALGYAIVTGLAYNVVKKAAEDLKTFNVEEEPPPPEEPPPAIVTKASSTKGNLQGLFSADDYPGDAANREEQGTVSVRLSIGADGRVAGCDVVSSSGSRSLDSATCRIIRQRARFTPARLSNGQPTTDTFSQRITWRLEG